MKQIESRVEAIRLQNFMAFKDTDWIELKPICVLFGRNSKGKSVIVRALRLLKQSLNSPSEHGPLTFLSEDGIDLGTFKSTVHGHDDKDKGKQIIIHFRCHVPTMVGAVRDIVNIKRAHIGVPSVGTDAPEKWLQIKLAFACPFGTETVLDEICISCPWPANGDSHCRTVFAAIRLDEETTGALKEEWWFWSDFLQEHIDIEESAWAKISMGLTSGFLPVLENSRQGPIQSISGLDLPIRGYVDKVLYQSRG